MSEPNPVAREQSPARLAAAQRQVIFFLLALAIPVAAGILIHPLAGLAVYGVVLIFQIMALGKLADEVGWNSGLVLAGLFVPALNLVILATASQRATETLRKAGYTVGFFGVSPKAFARPPTDPNDAAVPGAADPSERRSAATALSLTLGTVQAILHVGAVAVAIAGDPVAHHTGRAAAGLVMLFGVFVINPAGFIAGIVGFARTKGNRRLAVAGMLVNALPVLAGAALTAAAMLTALPAAGGPR